MNLKKTSLAAALLITMVGCQSTAENAQPTEDVITNLSQEEIVAFMSACDNPDSAAQGPMKKPLFVVGTFADSEWKHVPKRQYTYKGNNFYQVVVEEKAGTFKMQYATELWFPQFTAKGNRMNVGEITPLTFGGYGTDTAVKIEEDGKYVWSLHFDGKKPLHVMVNKCQ
ncbi:glycosidase [Vibrio sp. CAU 1672]|uniref:glycosidase n=1 Tax=Vibrio sp. CAU 1672 TaxID=3032594 RepID=UPI0023DB262B|nr:glycosidase [Vibrio sp. CAU 1672]MDF2153061.1 glycosidase [Vibrio sp. CAU 1672]